MGKMGVPELNLHPVGTPIYTASQKHESTLLHTYVMNEYLTDDRSCKTIFF